MKLDCQARKNSIRFALFAFPWILMILVFAAHAQTPPASGLTAQDLYILSTQWQKAGPVGSASDLNNDGAVNGPDLLLFIRNMHSSQVPVTPVPSSTPTPGIAPTGTPTVPEGTPTVPEATPTVPEETPPPTETATPTPGVEPTGTPGESPTPTLTPTPTFPITFEPVCVNFDTPESLALLHTYDIQSATELLEQGRLPDANQQVIAWYVNNSTTPENGIALSDPGSAAFNTNDGKYSILQTSILDLVPTFNTNQAILPRLTFDIAFSFEPPVDRVRDFLVVEVLGAGQTEYTPLDLNYDNQIVTDFTQIGDNPEQYDPNQTGIVDVFYSTTRLPGQTGSTLTKENFIHVELNLPKNDALKIAFRFQSDGSVTDTGAYLDNVCVEDVFQAGLPEITGYEFLGYPNNDSLYVDTRNRILIRGTNLEPIRQAVFNSGLAAAEPVPIRRVSGGFVVEIPRLTLPTQGTTARLHLEREDGQVSDTLFLVMKPAPKPKINSVSPSPYYLDAQDQTLTITGENFRPLYEDSTEPDPSVVTVTQLQGGKTVTFSEAADYLIRSGSEIVLDSTVLGNELLPGDAQVRVKNPFSNLESDPFTVKLEAGSGSMTIDRFFVDPGGSGDVFDPATEIFPLQKDQFFILTWEGENFSQSTLNISANNTPLVKNGVVQNADQVDLLVDSQTISLEVAPEVFSGMAEVVLSISQSGGTPETFPLPISDPQPPILYEDPEDYSTQTISLAEPGGNTLTIVGDNFRGYQPFSQNIPGESTTQAYLFPASVQNPTPQDLIELPPLGGIDLTITPGIDTGDLNDADYIYQPIPENWDGVDLGGAAQQEYRIRLVNPDSGLFVDSPAGQTVKITP